MADYNYPFSTSADDPGIDQTARDTITALTNSGQIAVIMGLTQAAYDAIPTKDPKTLYLIIG